MALITCPECGKSVSSLAATCPNCGCPIKEGSTSGVVRIKLPTSIEGISNGIFSSSHADIIGPGVSWTGQLGECARFSVEGPVEVGITLGRSDVYLKGTVQPGSSYEVVFQKKGWLGPVYRLTESW